MIQALRSRAAASPPATAAFDPVLEHLRTDGRVYFGQSPIAFEPVGRVQGRFSDVLRVRVVSKNAANHAFVKLFKPADETPERRLKLQKQILRDFTATRRAHEALAAYPGVAAVRPIACFPEELAIVTEEAAGETLDSVIRRDASWRPSRPALRRLAIVFERLGLWVRAFQALGGPPGASASRDKLRKYLAVRLNELVGDPWGRVTEGEGKLVLDRLERLLSRVGDDELMEVPIHADLSPGNVLVSGTNITVLDFTMSKTGTRFHDLAHMFLHLRMLGARPWFRPSVIETLQSAMLRGYDPVLAPDHPLFQVLVQQHVVCHLLRLAASPGRGPSRTYNAYLRRRQRDWLVGVATE